MNIMRQNSMLAIVALGILCEVDLSVGASLLWAASSQQCSPDRGLVASSAALQAPPCSVW